ncbi:MAG: 1-deoxy-D-xylulose-5-phosphate reductoisomerase [Verrucomicrobia bacterium]|nr:1-deoxy-D-xylulose-5-phosphate reductoisomerase [Verrucomicrobiota bacterium]
MKNVVLLGSSGSIGQSTLKVVADLRDEVRLVGLAARSSVDEVEAQVRALKPKAVAMYDEAAATDLKRRLPSRVKCLSGGQGLVELATMPEADIVLVAIVGTAGLQPALAAIRAGKDLAVASKEILVMAGEIVMREAKKYGVKVLPVDSEHSAIFQCLEGREMEDVRRLLLTASGGPFRKKTHAELERVTAADALRHPTWNMGSKITIDSASLFNKCLEMIEARWLFGLEMDRVEVVVHPQSIVHSMVEFLDGSVIAQLSVPDMRYPIQYAFTHPRRRPNTLPPTNFPALQPLTFETPDAKKFPALRLAREAARAGGTMPAVLNAANEVAVPAFMQGRIRFPQIWATVEKVMNKHRVVHAKTLAPILEADRWAREEAARLC